LRGTLQIFETKISNYSYQEILEKIDEKVLRKEKFVIHYVNIYLLQRAIKDNKFQILLDSFDKLHSDGIGTYLASKLLYGRKGLKEHLTGTDLYYKILELANKKKYRCFFYGGSSLASSLIEQNLKKKYPNLIISGNIPNEDVFSMETVKKISESNSDILFIGLGTPKQEEWVSQYSTKINIPVQLTTGSGIDFMSGNMKRAPLILRKTGFEWLFRLYLEPKRLWKRYIWGIPLFLFQISIFKLKLMFKEKN
jgi:N-acetylglucosaminyldiphosphoundecaprenol N-acetyl-beta-D-mannosaminyltransferase